MYYCFICEDINGLEENDPLKIQVKYADKIGKLILCDIKSAKIMDSTRNVVAINHKEIFLRGTCENYLAAAKIISAAGGILLETIADIEQIESWSKYIKPIRKIYDIKAKDIMEIAFDKEIMDFLVIHDKVFIKTRKKGCSICVSTEKIFSKDLELKKIIKELNPETDMLLSPYYEMDEDSYGKKEARFFVFNNEIKSCSRTLHSVKHSVSKRLKETALEVIEKISNISNFPVNYVLDIGVFKDEAATFMDVIELNPITCSLCYVNNSIFNISVPEIEEIVLKFGAGYEYCYDLLSNSNRYVYRKSVGDNFEYINVNHYNLL